SSDSKRDFCRVDRPSLSILSHDGRVGCFRLPRIFAFRGPSDPCGIRELAVRPQRRSEPLLCPAFSLDLRQRPDLSFLQYVSSFHMNRPFPGSTFVFGEGLPSFPLCSLRSLMGGKTVRLF